MNFYKTSILFSAFIYFLYPPQASADYYFAKEYIHSKQIQDQLTDAPATYRFSSRFDGKDSVSYHGQIFRQILINDLKKFMGTLERGRHNHTGDIQSSVDIMMDVLNSYFAYRSDNDNTANPLVVNAMSSFSLSAKDKDQFPLPLGQEELPISTYGELLGDGKNLLSKIAGNDNTVWERNLRRRELKGWGNSLLAIDLFTVDRDGAGDEYVEPEDLIDAFFRITAQLSVDGEDFLVPNGELPAQSVSEAYITENGLDLAQLTQKFLHGAVSFSQAASDYLYTGLSADNKTSYKDIHNYTAREHHWDEAFGYFGAARNFMDYKADEKGDLDADNNNLINIESEKILGVAKNTIRFDHNASPSENLQINSFRAFVQGRYLLGTRPAGYEETTRLLAIIALGEWEKTIAATVIHYINRTMEQMDSYGTQLYSFKKHAKYWSEMKGHAMAAQFSPTAILSDSDFDYFHKLVGNHPILGHQKGFAEYREQLIKAREVLTDAYKFSQHNKENW
ncbi:MAG: DUF4856 domain-containing protein [Halobacteriovoraceae bacterium]|nr:DUF4856 domain-containing protein [Halobacteriovoraceae bacterium]